MPKKKKKKKKKKIAKPQTNRIKPCFFYVKLYPQYHINSLEKYRLGKIFRGDVLYHCFYFSIQFLSRTSVDNVARRGFSDTVSDSNHVLNLLVVAIMY